MAKKVREKTSSTKKTSSKKAIPKDTKEDNKQKILVENFVALQDVMANLASKLNDLTGKISNLLDLFEDSAKAITEKGGLEDLGQGKEVAEKLDKLLNQNKVLAQGIALLHESNQNQGLEEPPEPENQTMQPHQPPPHQEPFPTSQQGPMQQNQPNQGRYQRSISSKY